MIVEDCVSVSISNTSRGRPTNKEYFSPHDLCESEIIEAEKKFAIPRRLLLAIGTVESGKAETGNVTSKRKRPWPWTICARGKSYFCSTKSAAIAMVKRFMARGVKNIDVGCMQINLLHHTKAFRDLEEAFTPKNNIEYAAKYFMQLKKASNSWTYAVGYYHSKSSRHYKPYCYSVYNVWKKVLDCNVNRSLAVCKASSEVKSDISFLPSYYNGFVDKKLSSKLHKLGRQSLVRSVPKFFARRQ
ncbi:MAG: transglycosylase SLT domain-containing protein [Holosporaceae bacterium]|nr:transglycosylase SLT domain-containing protein [Holosporaceae bacterium]